MSNKKRHKILIVSVFIILVLSITSISYILNKKYEEYLFKQLEVYSQYTTQNEKYTISLRDVSEAGLVGAIRLNVYLVNNNNNKIECIGNKRLDYYEDFVPYVDYIENDDSIVIVFYSKNSTDELKINLD